MCWAMAHTLNIVTVSQLSKRHGLTRRQIEHAIERSGVTPTAWVGNTKTFDATARARIEAALRATGALAAEPIAAEVRA